MDVLNMFFLGMIVEISIWCFFGETSLFHRPHLPAVSNQCLLTPSEPLLLYPITTSLKKQISEMELIYTYITNENIVDFFQFLQSVINFTIAVRCDVFPSACFHVGGGNTGHGIEACASSRNLAKLWGCFVIFLGFPRWNQITKAFGQSWQIWTIGCWTINFNDQPAISHSKMSLSYE